jgi:xylulokinase
MTAGFLGIDVGLSGARAVVISAHGKMLAQAKLEGATGTMSPPRLASLVDRTVRLALKGQPGISISSIAVAAFGPAPILIDERGDVLAQLRLFGGPSDGAADEAVDDDLEARLRRFRRLSPLLYRKACRICDVTGYLVARLTGQLTMDHATAADYERLSLPRRIALPRTAAGDARAGSLTAAAARRLGLSAGIPVAVGAYDSTADLVAAGFGKGREAVIILGSTMVLGTLTAAPLRDRRLRSMPHLDPGWFSGGWTNCAGASLALADTMLVKPVRGGPAAVPLVWPYFAGERAPVWAPHATGMIAGLRPDTTASALRRGFVQGVALSAADIADRIAAETGRIRHWTVTGGGSRDDALMSELADALGATLDVVTGAADHLGPAILAARSAGVDLRLPVARRHRPRKAAHRAYGERLTVYRQVFEAIRPLLAGIWKVTKSGSMTS